MKIPLKFKPFDTIVNKLANDKTRSKYMDPELLEIEIEDNIIRAAVEGTTIYDVEIGYNQVAVLYARCTCPYHIEHYVYCKHIVHVLVVADEIINEELNDSNDGLEEVYYQDKKENILLDTKLLKKTNNNFILNNSEVLSLSKSILQKLSNERSGTKRNWIIHPTTIQATIKKNFLQATISIPGYSYGTHLIAVQQLDKQIQLSCNCINQTNKLCTHLEIFLSEIQTNKDLQLAFDTEARHQLLVKYARSNSIDISNLDIDSMFQISLSYGRIYVDLKINLLSLSTNNKYYLKEKLLTSFSIPKDVFENSVFVLVNYQTIEERVSLSLGSAPITKNGKLKAPITNVLPSDRLRSATGRDDLLFLSSLIVLNNYQGNIENYKDVLKNPQGLAFYYHEESYKKEAVKVKNLIQITPSTNKPSLNINVKELGNFYVLSCEIRIDNRIYNLKQINIHRYLILVNSVLYALNNEAERKVLEFFNTNNEQIYIQKSQFPAFKNEFLDYLENDVTVSYSFIKPAPKALIKSHSLQELSQPILYLSDMDNYVAITPAISYGDIEVPVLSRRTAYVHGPDGTPFSIKRDEAAEQRLIRNIQNQHPSFEDMSNLEFFYLHKKEFLDEGWFIQAFEAWRQAGYRIHGFKELKDNRYNQNAISVKTSIQSGVDWFDIQSDISFGDQKVSLKQLQKSVLNKSRFIELTDGTHGILPEEWLEKFSRYFRIGEIRENAIRTSKTNFQLIDELFEKEVLSQEVKDELVLYKEKWNNFQSIRSVIVPKKLKASLRDYQLEGLNWLNFLDEFGFGGCLADDMGLGKTIQVIAYFLIQHEKGHKGTNLVVLPTSLLFNWQKELEKFAPHLRYHVHYGVKRNTSKVEINKYHVFLTTYGTLLSDLEWMKNQFFNIIVLDESQAIKNPNSKRYKAARLLKGRQRLVLTGTPVENNTFDLFAQLSFAVPGLLGSAKRFASDYSIPIDKFQDSKRAQELQRKVHPFILRRTKKQVALELPEKTEMTIYCQMGAEQRRVYDGYKHEFQKYLSGLDEDELNSSSLHVLKGLTKLRQICNSPILLGDQEYYGDDSAKLTEFIEKIRFIKDAHKVIVFSQFVGMLDLIKVCLEKESIEYAYLTGQTKNRQQQVELFQENENIRVFLISLKAGGTGLNLTQAEYVFLIDPWWNPAVENQAIDRAYRIGQKNKVIAIRFVTPDSIEEKILELQKRKRRLADELIYTDGNILKQLSKDDLLALL